MRGSALRRWGSAIALSLALSFGASAVQAQTSATKTSSTAPANTKTAIAIMQATAAMQSGRCDEAMPFLDQLWDDGDLLKSDPKLAEQFRIQRIICTIQLKDMAAGLAISADGLKHPGASIASYDLHVFLLLTNQRLDEAAATMREAIARFPESTPQLTDVTVMVTLLSLDTPKRRELLAALQRNGWQLRDPSGRLLIDFLRLDGLREAVKAGDKVLADLYRADIDDDAYVYALSQGDGNISDPAVPPQYVVPVVRGQIEAVKNYIANTPTDLPGMRYLVMLERSADEHELALVQLNGILQLIRANGLDKFQSPNTYPNLVLDKAVLLSDLGKPADALALYKDGTKAMRGPGTYDFVMSYMRLLINLGQDREALALESHVDFSALDEGEKREWAANSACAYAYLKDTDRYNLSLTMATAPSGIVDPRPYLCAGDIDGAAKAVITLINTPGARDGAIMLLQSDKPDIPHSERDKAVINGLEAVKKRPDVIAAAKAQNIIIRTWPLRF